MADEQADPEQQAKLAKKASKRRREPEAPVDPEEALRLKAKAARIAAEVFANAEPPADAPDEEEQPAKVGHASLHTTLCMLLLDQSVPAPIPVLIAEQKDFGMHLPISLLLLRISCETCVTDFVCRETSRKSRMIALPHGFCYAAEAQEVGGQEEEGAAGGGGNPTG